MGSHVRKSKDIFLSIAITLLVVLICMFFSLRFLTFHSPIPTDGKGGYARWGFPAIMAESSVYVAYVSSIPTREGRVDYIRKKLGRDWPHHDELLWDGILINLSCFSVFGMIIASIFTNKFLDGLSMVIKFICPEKRW